MTSETTPRPVVLCILDGWGQRAPADDNAISLADTPVWDRLMADAPHSLLKTSAEEVGLPSGQMGNSEVGHLNIGAGRVVMQELPRIDAAIKDGSFAANAELRHLIESLKNTKGTCHILGLMSPGGVHSHQRHIAALARLLDAAGVPVAVHALLDGRDTPPQSALGYLDRFESDVEGCSRVSIATVGGRYYGMDRDKRWDRVALAYNAIVEAEAPRADSARAAVEASYADDVTDEFVKPTVIGDYDGMRDGDAVVMINFRADRARQILTALLDPDFDGFARKRRVDFAAAKGMVEYSSELAPLMQAFFPPSKLKNILGEVVSKAGLKQLRIAETEKYAHVTFFLNGGEERLYDGEERILVPSPKVATYDLQPEMSAREVTDRLTAAIRDETFDLIVVNFANTDMVGHTGKIDAAIKAVETVDECLGRVIEALDEVGGCALITADHGNAEQMRDPDTGAPHTAHTTNPVPLVLAGRAAPKARLHDGRLADLAPSVLALMGLPQPAEMTGRNLVEVTNAAQAATATA